jgi:acetyltransferase-like isoleucine patch superfamily enzyme
MNLSAIAKKIRRRETPFYDRMFRFLKSARALNVPVVPPLHRALYVERLARLATWHWFIQTFYYVPLFKSQCRSYGKGLTILGGIPQIIGDLNVYIGDNCLLHGTTNFVGAKVFDQPTVRIGDNTHLGYNLQITVGCDITIGKNVMIGGGVNILSYDGHPVDPAERHNVAPKETSKPIVIGDNAWIGTRSFILKGVTIGENSIVAANTVVTKNIPPNSLFIGDPTRITPLTREPRK